MGVSEQNASFREPIDVRRFRLRVPSKDPDPIVQIVNGDKEHVRSIDIRLERQRTDSHKAHKHLSQEVR